VCVTCECLEWLIFLCVCVWVVCDCVLFCVCVNCVCKYGACFVCSSVVCV